MKRRKPRQRSLIADIFGLDLRSLAAFRVGLAVFVLYDLIHRAFDLTAHYTDDGAVPRDFLLRNLWDPHALSLHMITGSFTGVAMLFVIHGIAAFGLLLGLKTRWMTCVVWLLTASLHTRNPLILNGGDDLIRVVLFFSIFLPLGARYSIDSALDTAKDDVAKSNTFVSPATVVYYLQFICVYFFAALLKSGSEWRTQGTGIYYALSLDQLVLPLGKALLHFPDAMKAMTFAVWWIELLGGFIFLIPHPAAKVVGILLIGSLQLGFGLTLALGHFPWVNAIVLLPFLPGIVWDRRLSVSSSSIFYDPDCGFCRKAVFILVEFVRPNLMDKPSPAHGADLAALRRRNSWIVRDENGASYFEFDALIRIVASSPLFFWLTPLMRIKPLRAIGTTAYRIVANRRRFFGSLLSPLRFRRVYLRTPWWSDVLVLFFFAVVLISNLSPFISSATLNSFVNIPLMLTRLDEYWGMFAPAPTREDGWYVIEGKLNNGAVADAFRQSMNMNYDKPSSAGDFYSNERWRKFMMNIWLRDYKNFRAPFARYLCWNWNRENTDGRHMNRITITFMLERTPPPGEASHVERVILGDYPCEAP